MYFDDKRLVAGVAGALVLAAGGGFMAARWTSEPSTAAAPAKEAAEAAPTSLDLSAEAIRNSGSSTLEPSRAVHSTHHNVPR